MLHLFVRSPFSSKTRSCKKALEALANALFVPLSKLHMQTPKYLGASCQANVFFQKKKEPNTSQASDKEKPSSLANRGDLANSRTI